ncbi:MAG: 16S rRNA (uracil(1498)-N(3))-methyltransferase [Actinomycetota bacterium]|nr:16S rRNA (uracil(1498)-N(3))-methyltransferase [Actinomycetota bacterium]
MSVPVFWRESLDASDDGGLVLDGGEGHHAAVVRRLAVGEQVRVTDGRGSYVEGPVATVGKGAVSVWVGAPVSVPAPTPRLTVVQAVPKGDRAELAVQALVEVGVDRIVPWASERSQVRVAGERGERLLAKWRAWAFEAGKQARRSWFCEVAPPLVDCPGVVASTAAVATLLASAHVGLVLHEDAPLALGAVPLPERGDVVLVIGPEGGIGAAELAALGVPGASVRPPPPQSPIRAFRTPQGAPSAARLGDTVLRTSTAGAVAAGVVLAATRWR